MSRFIQEVLEAAEAEFHLRHHHGENAVPPVQDGERWVQNCPYGHLLADMGRGHHHQHQPPEGPAP